MERSFEAGLVEQCGIYQGVFRYGCFIHVLSGLHINAGNM